ncbi:hypothetical protein F4779DRAFT_622880 [Xylariaceae sp. FL0662B]|nr:hypothetical protein F4779DRAFT_622880 [Xylariaceae sp. FL0662B]
MFNHGLDQLGNLTMSIFTSSTLRTYLDETWHIVVWVISVGFTVAKSVLLGLAIATDIDSLLRSENRHLKNDLACWQELEKAFVRIVFIASLLFPGPWYDGPVVEADHAFRGHDIYAAHVPVTERTKAEENQLVH